MGISHTPVSGILPRQGAKASNVHLAEITLVGWPQYAERERYRVAGHTVDYLPERLLGQRVKLVCWPRTMSNGQLYTPLHLGFRRSPRRKEPNGATFRVVGRLMKLDPVKQLLQVLVYPVKADVDPFEVRICATPRVMRTIDPGWTGVEIRGGMIGNQLIADEIRPVYAPVSHDQMRLLAKERLQARRRAGQWRRHAVEQARQRDRHILRQYLRDGECAVGLEKATHPSYLLRLQRDILDSRI